MDKNSDELKSNRRLNLKNISNESETYDGVGSDLKVARIRKGLNIKDVASAIRISTSYLEAIEQGRFDDLPGDAYIIGFVKAYSKFLGMDQYIVLEQFKKESIRSNNTALEFPITRDRYNYPTKKILLSSLVLIIIVYFIYVYFDRDNKETAKDINSVPQRIINESVIVTPRNDKGLNDFKNTNQLNTDRMDDGQIAENNGSELNVSNKLKSGNILESEYKETKNNNKNLEESESLEESENLEESANLEALDDPVVLQQEDYGDLELNDNQTGNNQTMNKKIAVSSFQEQSQNNADIANSKTFILATEDIWAHVETVNGKILYSGIILEGNRLNIPITKKLIFSTGNGGAFKLLINGIEGNPIGKNGEIIQGFAFSKED